VQSASILSQTILFKGNLAQPQKYCPKKYLGYTVLEVFWIMLKHFWYLITTDFYYYVAMQV